jgi:C4-dicarboxylate-specific signal transduction histidine kinase
MTRRRLKNQAGQAMIEAAFMLFLLSFFLMFLLWGRTLYESMARAQETLRYDLRKKLDGMAKDSFQRVEKKAEATLKVPGTIGEKLEQNPVRVKMRAIGYGGSYQGKTKSEYLCGQKKRTIKE